MKKEYKNALRQGVWFGLLMLPYLLYQAWKSVQQGMILRGIITTCIGEIQAILLYSVLMYWFRKRA